MHVVNRVDRRFVQSLGRLYSLFILSVYLAQPCYELFS